MEILLEKIRKEARDSWPGDEGMMREKRVEEFVRKRCAEYSALLGFTEFQILEAMENGRDYSAVNYYSEHRFPPVGCFTVYETTDDLLKAVAGDIRFRCPSCKGITTDPYACNSGLPMKTSSGVCDWKVYGLLGTMGEGYRFTIRDRFLEIARIDEIFMPISFEKTEPEESQQEAENADA